MSYVHYKLFYHAKLIKNNVELSSQIIYIVIILNLFQDYIRTLFITDVQTSTDTQGSIEDTQTGSIADSFLEMEVNEGVETVDSSINCPKTKIPASTFLKDVETTPKLKNNMCLTETTKKNINNISASIIKRKIQKQINEDAISKKKLDILEIQRQQELIKLEKNKVILDLDIELKRVLLENAKIDLECKKKMYNL